MQAASRTEIGQRLRWARTQNGVTLDQVAPLVGLTPAALVDVEDGQQGLGLPALQQMALLYGYTVGDLLDPGTVWGPEGSAASTPIAVGLLLTWLHLTPRQIVRLRAVSRDLATLRRATADRVDAPPPAEVPAWAEWARRRDTALHHGLISEGQFHEMERHAAELEAALAVWPGFSRAPHGHGDSVEGKGGTRDAGSSPA